MGASTPVAGLSGRTNYRWSYSIQTCVGKSSHGMTDTRTRTVRFTNPKKCNQRRLRVGDG